MAPCFTPRFSPLGCWPNVPLHSVRGEIRSAFARWGLPARLRVDNGTPWGSWGEFPTDLSLWLIGLNISMHWNNARRPQENGVVERSQGTSARWCEPWTCESPEELQERLVRMDRLYREEYPYRDGLSRMRYFARLSHSGRPYDPTQESRVWQWEPVAEHLAGYVVTRKVDSTGQVSLYGRSHYVGKIHSKKEVHVMYDPNRNEWVISDRDGTQLRNLPADWLSPQSVMDLEVTRRRK